MKIFFETAQQIYNFFMRGIKRWNILSSFILVPENKESASTSVTLKILNLTRCVRRYGAMFALKVQFFKIQKAPTKTILLSSKSDENMMLFH